MRQKRVKRSVKNRFPRLQFSALRRAEERLSVKGERIEAVVPNGELQTLLRRWRLTGCWRGDFVSLWSSIRWTHANENAQSKKHAKRVVSNERQLISRFSNF
jgi:hypothetical protein